MHASEQEDADEMIAHLAGLAKGKLIVRCVKVTTVGCQYIGAIIKLP